MGRAMVVVALSLATGGGLGLARAQPSAFVEYAALVDEHDTPLPAPLPEGWYFNAMGGDRGVLNAGDLRYSRDGASAYRADVVGKAAGAQWTWGGMWYSLIRQNDDDVPLDFRAIFGPHVAPAYQGQVVGLKVVVKDVASITGNTRLTLRLEAKNAAGAVRASWSFPLAGQTYPRALSVTIDPAAVGQVEQLLWVVDGAQVGDSVSVDGVQLQLRVPALPPEEQAFLWSYSWLMTNYNASTGMVKDKSRDGRLPAQYGGGDSMESVPATAKAAKIVYYAYRKGYLARDQALAIITKIADTLIRVVPRGPAGANTIWPHFTENGGANPVPPRFGFNGTEWSTGDTAYAALDLITALQLIGDPQGQLPALESMLASIDWSVLLIDGAVSHGYDDRGVRIPYTWRGFGMETLGVNWVYASVSGQLAAMLPTPSDNGSGFIDNAQYPMAFVGVDRWGNDWDAYRNTMAQRQIGWYCQPEHSNAFLCGAQLFGLSAAETPEPAGLYEAYGIGGAFSGPVDGNGEVVALHYSGMIADLRPAAAKQMWSTLVERPQAFWGGRIVVSPLNNLESLRVDKTTGQVTVNHLKGSWNLVLQTEGWALIDRALRDEVFAATQTNAFLKRGFDRLSAGYTLHLGVDSGRDRFPRETAAAAHLSGAAAARMNLRFLDPSYTGSQEQLYATYHRGVAGEELSALELAEALNAETRALGGYHFEASGDVDQLEAIRRVVHWMDYLPPGGQHVPALVPTGGGLAWKVVRGFVVDAKPFDASDPFRIPPVELRGVWLNDPRVTGLGYNVFQTAAFFRDEYRPVSGLHYSVNEPPQSGTVSASTRFARQWRRDRLRIAHAEAREELSLLAEGGVVDAEPEAPARWAARVVSRARRFQGLFHRSLAGRWGGERPEARPERFVLALLREALPSALSADPAFMQRFDRAAQVRGFEVADEDQGSTYVLLALGGRDRAGEPSRAELVLQADPVSRTLLQATWADEALVYPGVTANEAVLRARAALQDLAPRGFRGLLWRWRLRLAHASVSRFWAARHGQSRFHPSYRVALAGHTALVHADGHTELDP
ncbi:MAG: hypothetical protein IPL40_02420 [Proteobacteria bacterium]|nr:hypothetical protein [Pseudomonadota bacterium]